MMLQQGSSVWQVLWQKRFQFWQCSGWRHLPWKWIASQDISNCALKQCLGQASFIRNLVSMETKASKGVCLADDLSQMSGSNVTITNSPTTNLNKLQRIIQLANDNHHASGGSFPIPKCSFHSVTVTRTGKLISHPVTFSIWPTPSSSPEQFQQKPIEEGNTH